MDIKEADHRYDLNKVKYSVRTMQAVLQYGVGAMVDFKEQTLMTAAPEYWSDSIIKIYDERLQKALGVSYFGMPASKVNNQDKNGISYARFPEWYFCPKCRQFKPLKDWVKEYKVKGNKKAVEEDPQMIKHMQCPKCRQNLVVARLVTVCEHGHIDDFPWVKWVHAKNFSGAKEVCKYPSLELRAGNSSNEGLESLKIVCRSCGASATLKGAFGEESGNPFAIDNDDRVSFCVMDKGYRNDGEWALNIKSVIIFGRINKINDSDKAIKVLKSLALKYYPTASDAEREVEKAGDRALMLELTIDHMTGKLVNES